jgi:predicted nucleotidyltransferase
MIMDTYEKALKEYFKTRKYIAFAFLFGSQARGKATKLSDVDIAVYFYPEKRHPIEYEEEVFYEGEDKIWADLERILKREVELLVLNRVSATVSASAIRGIPLVINDWGLFLDFMDTVTREAEDFMEMTISDFLFEQKVKT